MTIEDLVANGDAVAPRRRGSMGVSFVKPVVLAEELETPMLRAFGYTTEPLELLINPMAADGIHDYIRQ